MDEKTKRILSTWAVAMLIFFAVALVCIGFIFAGVKEGRGDNYVTYPASSLLGGQLLGESWKRYPEYTLGLGIAGGLSFIGAVFCIFNIYKEKEKVE